MLIQTQSPSLRPLTTAHLAQTMSLLELSWDELRQRIESELNTNPALEIVEQKTCPSCHRRIDGYKFCPVCSNPAGSDSMQPVVYISSREDFPIQGKSTLNENLPDEEITAYSLDLSSYIFRQISAEIATKDRPLTAHILACINEDGLLDVSIYEIAQYCHVPLSQVEKILHIIQRANPLGVGSSSPKQALLVQLEVLSETQEVPPLAHDFIRNSLDLLSRRSYGELSKKYQIPLEQVNDLVRYISENLNPYPGRENWGGNSPITENPAFIYPDIIIEKQDEKPDTPLLVEILSPYAGSLRVSSLFKKAVSEAPPEKTSEWQSSLDAATLLVKCLRQRNQALVKMMRRLVVIQRDFILLGDAYMIPFTRAQLAKELEVHESTISRAVSGKVVQLPNRRLIPLSHLFDRSLQVRTILKEIIQNENQPLSDTQLAELLEKQGYPVARRTVAKYRAIEGIPPSRFRIK